MKKDKLKPLIDPKHFADTLRTFDGADIIYDGLSNSFVTEKEFIEKEKAKEKAVNQRLIKTNKVLKSNKINKKTVKPFKKKANSATVQFDPTPIAPMPSEIQDPVAEELKQRLNKLVKDAEEEKLKDNSQGLAGLLGGII